MSRLRLLLLLVLLGTAACEFPGMHQSSHAPADAALAVTPRFFIQATNEGIRVWDRASMQSTDLNMQATSFGVCNVRGDRRVYYDAAWDRIYLVANDLDGNFCFSVSQTNDPRDPWWQYKLPVPSPGGGDHPTLGWSAQAIVLVNGYFGTTSYLLNKQEALAGRLATYTWYHQQAHAHAVRGNTSLNSVYAFVVEPDSNLSGVTIWRFGGAPPGQVQVKHARVDTGPFGQGGPYVQGDVVYDVIVKLYDAVQRADNQRLYVVVDDRPGASIRLFEFQNLLGNWPPQLNSSTVFSDPGAALFQASIDLDANGTAWVAANCSATTVPLSLCLGGRYDGDTGTRAMAVVKLGTEWYNANRAGDYTTTVRDPADPKFVYLTGQIGLPHGYWGTWIMQAGSTCTLNPRQCT